MLVAVRTSENLHRCLFTHKSVSNDCTQIMNAVHSVWFGMQQWSLVAGDVIACSCSLWQRVLRPSTFHHSRSGFTFWCACGLVSLLFNMTWCSNDNKYTRTLGGDNSQVIAGPLLMGRRPKHFILLNLCWNRASPEIENAFLAKRELQLQLE